MGKLSRSLKVHSSKVGQIRRTFEREGFKTLKDFAEEMGMHPDTVRKFRKGQPISRPNFLGICEVLDLDWQDLVFGDEEDLSDGNEAGDDLSSSQGASESGKAEPGNPDSGKSEYQESALQDSGKATAETGKQGSESENSGAAQTAADEGLLGDRERPAQAGGLVGDRFTQRPVLPAQPRVFLSYKRNVQADGLVALAIYEALKQHCHVFIDRSMAVGTPWSEQIAREIAQADALIVLLSAQAVQSEMVQREIELARQSAGKRQGLPMILPVRLAYRVPFSYPLNEYLDRLQWALWDGPEDTPRLIEALKSALAGKALPLDTEAAKREVLQLREEALPPPDPAAQPPAEQMPFAIALDPTTLESPEGTMAPDSGFYIQREADEIAFSALRQRNGGTVTILGPRQMGKSSLLFQTMAMARKRDKRVAWLDFQQFEQMTLQDAELFFRRFCEWLTRKLRLSSRVEEFWQANKGLGNPLRCTYYMEDYLLAELGQPLLLAMDEVDRLIKSPFRDEFFAMLRSWHNERADFESPWQACDLVMVTSTEPYQLIKDMHQSPFNVGTTVTLVDFSLAEVAELNRRHGMPYGPQQQAVLMDWVNGHPYLVRKALYLVAIGQMSVEDVFATAVQDRGPFGGHLRYHLLRMEDKAHLVEGMLQVIRSQSCSDEQVLRRLEGAGLVRRGEGRHVLPRCKLYAEYFRKHLQ